MHNYHPTVTLLLLFLPMVVSNSPDIFQQKVNDLLQGF